MPPSPMEHRAPLRVGPLAARPGAVDVYLKVTPGAGRNALGEVADDGQGVRRLGVRVTAKADGGQANRAVLGLLSRTWSVPVSALSIASGHTNRLKRVRLVVDEEKAAAIMTMLGQR